MKSAEYRFRFWFFLLIRGLSYRKDDLFAGCPLNQGQLSVYAKYQACVFAGQSDELLDVRVFAGEEQAIHYVDFADNLYNVELPDHATCLEVRMRDFAGEISPPARRCFDLDQAPVLTPPVCSPFFLIARPQISMTASCRAKTRDFRDASWRVTPSLAAAPPAWLLLWWPLVLSSRFAGAGG